MDATVELLVGAVAGGIIVPFAIELFRRMGKQRDQIDSTGRRAVDEFKTQNHRSHEIMHEKLTEERKEREALDKRVQAIERDGARNAETLSGMKQDIHEIRQTLDQAFPRRARSGMSGQMGAVRGGPPIPRRE